MERRPFRIVNRRPVDQIEDVEPEEIRQRINVTNQQLGSIEEEIRRLQQAQLRLQRVRENLQRSIDERDILRPSYAPELIDQFEDEILDRIEIEEAVAERQIEEEKNAEEEKEEEREDQEEEEEPNEEEIQILVNKTERTIDGLIQSLQNREGAETNPLMIQMLARFREFARTNMFNPSIEDLTLALQFINDDDDYAIFKFFAVVYRGFVPNPAEERFSFDRSFESWKESFVRNLRVFYPIYAGDFTRNAQGGSDILINRLNVQQVKFAIDRVIDVIKSGYQEEERANRFVTAARAVFTENYMQGAYIHADYEFEAAEVDFLWEMFITTLRLMRTLWANNITLPDILLNQKLYYEDTVNGTSIRLLQTYPFLLSKSNYYGYKNDGYELMMNDTRNKMTFFAKKAKVKDVMLKVRIKEVHTKKNIGTEVVDLDFAEERWRVLTIDPLSFNGSDEFRVFEDFSEEVVRVNLETFGLTPVNELIEWFTNEILKQLRSLSDNYKDYEVLDGEINLDYILIDYILAVGIEAQDSEIPERGPSLMTAFCKSASYGMIRKTAFFSECTSMGICIFEALWTKTYLNKIRGRCIDQDTKLSYWKREDREKLMLRDFDQAPNEVKLMALHGDLKLMMELFSNETPFIIWEKDLGLEDIENLSNEEACFVVMDAHVFCADPIKVINQIQKRMSEDKKKKLKRESEEVKWEDKAKFALRPKYTKKEMKKINKDLAKGRAKRNQPDQLNEEEENEERGEEEVREDNDGNLDYYLDIETSINKDTGKFTPYLICVVGEGEENVWWGKECVMGFLEWLNTKVDQRKGVEVSHNHKSEKVNIWTYNGMKFDLVFLVRHFINMPEFTLQGSISSIKGLSIGNVVFRDLLKICPFGSLAKQSNFWKTSLKKGSVNHDDITDAKIEYMESNKYAVDVQILKTEIIEYCVLDCKVLGECVEKYKNWVRTNLDIDPYVISTAGLALRYWSTHHNPAKIPYSKKIKYSKLAKGLPQDIYPIVRESYKGGIVMVVKKIKEESKILQQGDINSSYPKVMEGRVPYKCTGVSKFQYPKDIMKTPYLTLNDCHLYQVASLKWKNGMRIPTIPKRVPEGLNHTTKHSAVDYIWGIELKYAMETGWLESGSLTAEYIFKSDYMFKSYVDELYHKRRAACKRNGDTIGDKFYKLLLNSLYGKFGQKLYKKKVVCNDRKLAYYADLINGVPEEVCEGVWLAELDDDNYEEQIGSCIHIASFITASARTNLMRAVGAVSNNFNEDNIYYMDTDCIITHGDFPPELIDDYQLGKWAIEKANITEYLAPAKKMYYLKYSDQTIMKSKGITSHLMTKEDYEELINNGVVKGKFGGDKWVRNKQGYVSKQMNVKDLKVNNVRFYYNNGLSSMPMFE